MKKVGFLVCLLSALALGEDTFTVKPQREVHALGLKRTAESRAFVKGAKRMERPSIRALVSIPGALDLSAKVSPPEDQGGCGSCWDFSITKALRSALMLVGKDPGVLSFNYLLNNCSGVPAAEEGGCNGGDFPAGQGMINGLGPWLESQDPYTQSEGRCKNLPVKGTALKWISVASGNSAPTFQELAYAISQNHMLSIDVAVCGRWGSYSGGIFNENACGANSINHMINMVGYDCESSKDDAGNCVFNTKGMPVKGDGYLKVENNWGESFGENGYMRTRYGMDAVADTAMYFEVDAPPVPPVPPIPPVPPVPEHALPLWLIIVLVGLGALGLGFVIAKLTQKH